MRPHYERITGATRMSVYFGERRPHCTKCGKRQGDEYVYDDDRNVVCTAGCGQVIFELRIPAPKVPEPKPVPVVTDRDRAIRKRIEAAERHLDAAVADVVSATARVKKWRARIGRLTAAVNLSAEQRSARALVGFKTRVTKHRIRGVIVRKEQP